jgi:hypothetical protein
MMRPAVLVPVRNCAISGTQVVGSLGDSLTLWFPLARLDRARRVLRSSEAMR